jgi:CheY-like chemotaxis protein
MRPKNHSPHSLGSDSMYTKGKKTYSNKGSKGTILLVGEKIPNTLTKRLLSYRYKIIEVEDGFEALETLRRHTVDLIISTLDLPKMDCLELMMNLRDLNINSPLVILENTIGEEKDTSITVTDIWGYCYLPVVTSKMNEVLGYLKEPST